MIIHIHIYIHTCICFLLYSLTRSKFKTMFSAKNVHIYPCKIILTYKSMYTIVYLCIHVRAV